MNIYFRKCWTCIDRPTRSFQKAEDAYRSKDIHKEAVHENEDADIEVWEDVDYDNGFKPTI